MKIKSMMNFLLKKSNQDYDKFTDELVKTKQGPVIQQLLVTPGKTSFSCVGIPSMQFFFNFMAYSHVLWDKNCNFD